MSRTVDLLVQEVRDSVDEENTSDLSDEEILRFLNRAQKQLARLVARHAPFLFKREASVTSTGARTVDVPSLALGFVVSDVSYRKGTSYFPVQRMPLRVLSDWDNASPSNSPVYYATLGRSLALYPTATSGTVVRIRYQYRPPELVMPQGRVTAYGVTGAGGSTVAVSLDSLGSGLSTSVSDLSAFVNVVDSLTGEIKATLQVSNINTTTKVVTFKSASLDRDTVFGLTVSDELPADVAKDDLLCLASGVCVPLLFQDYDDYIVAVASVELKKKLGESVQEDLGTLSRLEDDLKVSWAGREAYKKVERLSKFWG